MPPIAPLFYNAKEYDPMPGRVKGTFPEWLEGVVVRNGPGIFDLDDGQFTLNHFFDGFAMMSKFEIKNGKVTFQQKILDTEAYRKSLVAKRNVFAEFGTKAHPDPTKSMLGKMFNKLIPLELTDNTVGSCYKIGEELFASYESCFIHKVDIDSLVSKERYDFTTSIGAMTVSCHPLTDADGATWNIAASMLSGCKYHIFKIPSPGSGKASEALKKQKIVATIPSSWRTCVSYFHSFGMTKNYIIFMEQPMIINCVKLAQMGIKGKSIREAFEWTPSERNRIYLIEKSTGNVLKTKYRTSEPFFSFHFGNAYETNDQIVVDMITYPSGLIFDKFELKKLRCNEFIHDDPAQLQRFIIPVTSDFRTFPENVNIAQVSGIDAKAVRTSEGIILTPISMAPAGLEYPKYNPRYMTKPAQYLYASGTYDVGFHKNSICKLDLGSGNVVLHKSEHEDEFFGEPIFIPQKDRGVEEDDGLILSTVSCSDPNRPDYLVCLDAKEFKEIGRAEFDAKFLQTFHGTFVCPHQ